MSSVIALPSRFDRRLKLSAYDVVINDDDDGITVPFLVWVFITCVETEAGIQYAAETVSPTKHCAVGGTESSAIYRLIVRLIGKAP